MFKMIAKQISRHPIGLSILIFGYIISLLMISIGTTSIIEMKQLALAKTEGSPKNALTINSAIDKNIDFTQYISLINNINPDSNIRFLGIKTYIDNGEKNFMYDLNCEFFRKKPDWTYPLIKGRYYTSDEISESKRVVLIGKDLDKYTSTHNNEKYISLSGENYKVVGLIGKKNKKTPWDSSISMPITSIPELCKRVLLKPLSLNCVIYNANCKTDDDANKIKDNISKIDNKAIVSINELSSKNNIIANKFGSNDNLIIMSLLIFISSLLNSVNITSYWINDRRKEIGIKKAFGHTDVKIASMLLTEMLIINSLACIISLLCHYMLSLFIDNIYKISLNISIENFLVAILMTLISSMLTSIIPIYKSLSIQPIDALKV